MVIVEGNGHNLTSSKILDEAVCILHIGNALVEGMNPVILSAALSKLLGRLSP